MKAKRKSFHFRLKEKIVWNSQKWNKKQKSGQWWCRKQKLCFWKKNRPETREYFIFFANRYIWYYIQNFVFFFFCETTKISYLKKEQSKLGHIQTKMNNKKIHYNLKWKSNDNNFVCQVLMRFLSRKQQKKAFFSRQHNFYGFDKKLQYLIIYYNVADCQFVFADKLFYDGNLMGWN
jgi:hypothetical protein